MDSVRMRIQSCEIRFHEWHRPWLHAKHGNSPIVWLVIVNYAILETTQLLRQLLFHCIIPGWHDNIVTIKKKQAFGFLYFQPVATV